MQEPYFIDSHAHLDDDAFQEDRDEVIKRANESNIRYIVNMGDNIEHSKKSVILTKKYPSIYTGVGIHPGEVTDITKETEEALLKLLQEEKVVAVGEIGLDYYFEKDTSIHQKQQELFIWQLDIAKNLHKPVCIHDREAHGDMLKILKREGKGVVGVIHCYSGSLEFAKELLKLGYYLGVDGPITYKNATNLRKFVEKIPLDRLLLETDSPYLSPLPYRGKRNEPKNILEIAQKVADIRQEPLEKIAMQTSKNVHDIYRF